MDLRVVEFTVAYGGRVTFSLDASGVVLWAVCEGEAMTAEETVLLGRFGVWLDASNVFPELVDRRERRWPARSSVWRRPE